MKKKLFSILTVMLIAALSTSTVYAAGFKLTAGFKLGSLIADGFVSGIGNTDVTVVLDASGTPYVICSNQGGQQAPGQNPPSLSATGSQSIPADKTKNGKTPFDVTAESPTTLSGSQGGCPNDHWTGTVTFVFWNSATISVYSTSTGVLLIQQNYTCVTTANHIPPTSFTDGTVSCTPQ